MDEVEELRSILRRVSDRLDQLEGRKLNVNRIVCDHLYDPGMAVLMLRSENPGNKPILLVAIGSYGEMVRVQLGPVEVAEARAAGLHISKDGFIVEGSIE